MIRLYPATSQTSDQQLDDVVAVIRAFRAHALATAAAKEAGHTVPTTKSDFQHLCASPDEMSRNELPEYFIQSSVQISVQERDAQALAKEAATKAGPNGLHRTHYFAVPDDVYF